MVIISKSSLSTGAGFELTPELIKNGYAQKPIAGRRGDNVKLIGECKSVLDSKDGRFGKQESYLSTALVFTKSGRPICSGLYFYCRWALWW